MPSAGFLVISFVAVLVVIAPSAVLAARGWGSGNISRISTLLAVLLLGLVSWVSFTDPDVLDFESRAVMVFAVWGSVLYLGFAVYGCVKAVLIFYKRRRA
jgi:hypothetical protein